MMAFHWWEVTVPPMGEPTDAHVDLVDSDDRVVGVRCRSELVDGVDRWRIVAVFVVSSDRRRVLLARRAMSKRHDPGAWAPPVAGTVEAADTYLDTAVRETFEELGLHVAGSDLELLYAGPLDSAGQLRNAAVYVHAAAIDEVALNVDPDEVAELGWFDLYSVTTATRSPCAPMVATLAALLDQLSVWAGRDCRT